MIISMVARPLALPLLSAILGMAALRWEATSWLGFLFLAPLFLFFLAERKLWRLIIGAFLFRWLFAGGSVYFAFEPLGWLASSLIFLGLPVSFFIVRRYLGPNQALAALPLLWAIWDLLEARFTFLPVYIMTAGNIFGSSPFLGLAKWGGIVGLTFFSALVNVLLAAIILSGRRRQLAYAAFGLLIVSSGWLISRYQLDANARGYSGNSKRLSVAAVSTNEDFDHAFRNFESDALSPGERQSASGLIAETLRPLGAELQNRPIDLLILPEDMIDLESWEDRDAEAYRKFGIESGGVLIRAYRELAQELKANLAATFTTIQNGKRYNTTILFNRQGELIGRYNKARLAIGGEYWPFGEWRPFYWNLLSRLRPEISQDSPVFDPQYQYTAGEPLLLETENLSFASLICIEIHYPSDLKDYQRRGIDFISHTSNNRWVSFGLPQYLRLTDNLRKIEAVWLGLPMVINGRGERAAIIYPDGRMEAVPFERPDKPFNIFFGTLRI